MESITITFISKFNTLIWYIEGRLEYARAHANNQLDHDERLVPSCMTQHV